MEQLLLLFRIVQFGVGVGYFHPIAEQLKSLSNRRIIFLAFRQRSDARGLVDDKYRSLQVMFQRRS